MLLKNYQMQNLQRAIKENRSAKFIATTALQLAHLSLKIEPLVTELEKQLIALAQEHRTEDDKGLFVLNETTYRAEAEPLVIMEVEVDLPETFAIRYRKETELTVDFIRFFMDIYGDKVSFDVQ
jgi:hypothetical protein